MTAPTAPTKIAKTQGSPSAASVAAGSAELADAASPVLDRLVARAGSTSARLSALAFLARYFQDEGQAEDDLATLTTQVAAQATELAELREALALARTAAERAEADGLVRRLRRDAALANAPIPEVELTRLASLVTRGDLELARAFGDALLGKSQAHDQRAFRRPTTVRLDDGAKHPQRASTEVQARVLRSRGWAVEVSTDGAEITRAGPLTRPGGEPGGA